MTVDAQVDRLRAALREARMVLALCTTRHWPAPEDEEVRRLGERLGFGALISAASKCWADVAGSKGIEGSQHTAGPCKATVDVTLALIDAALADAPPATEAHREHAFRAVPCAACGDYRSGREEVVKVSRAGIMPFGGSEDAPPLVLCLACARRIGEAAKVRR